jgi:putative FmdB family regulatory protein
MPIYEFYCPHCHRVFSFLSRSVNTEKTPACPRCAGTELTRRVSAFAISKGRREEPKPEPEASADESRLEQAMSALAGEMDSIDENDPRQGAQLMRKLFSATGMPIAGGMEEALRRMEAGEDPERIEEQMGDALEGDPLGGLLGASGSEAGEQGPEPAQGRLGRLRRMLPPSHDPELYEMD